MVILRILEEKKMPVVYATDNDFQSKLASGGSNLVVVDFTATWYDLFKNLKKLNLKLFDYLIY